MLSIASEGGLGHGPVRLGFGDSWVVSSWVAQFEPYGWSCPALWSNYSGCLARWSLVTYAKERGSWLSPPAALLNSCSGTRFKALLRCILVGCVWSGFFFERFEETLYHVAYVKS